MAHLSAILFKSIFIDLYYTMGVNSTFVTIFWLQVNLEELKLIFIKMGILEQLLQNIP